MGEIANLIRHGTMCFECGCHLFESDRWSHSPVTINELHETVPTGKTPMVLHPGQPYTGSPRLCVDCTPILIRGDDWGTPNITTVTHVSEECVFEWRDPVLVLWENNHHHVVGRTNLYDTDLGLRLRDFEVHTPPGDLTLLSFRPSPIIQVLREEITGRESRTVHEVRIDGVSIFPILNQ